MPSIAQAIQPGGSQVAVSFLKSPAIAQQVIKAVLRRAPAGLIKNTPTPQSVGKGVYWMVVFHTGELRMHDERRFPGANDTLEAKGEQLHEIVKAVVKPGHLILEF